MSVGAQPFPVAALLRRARMAHSPKERHDAAYYAWEVSIRLVVASAPPGDVSELARASLGHWVRAARLPDWTIESGPVLAAYALMTEVGAGKGARPRSVSPRRLVDAVPAYRNRVMGHGGQRGAGFYEEAGPTLAGGLEHAWEAGAFLPRDSRLIHVDTVELDTTGARRARVVDLTGPLPQAREWIDGPKAEGLLPRRVYLQEGAAFRELHPWVLFRDDELRERTYFFNGLGSAVEYLDYASGEIAQNPSGMPSLEADVRRVFGSSPPQDPPEPSAPPQAPGAPAGPPADEAGAASARPTAGAAGGRAPSPFYHRTPIVDPAHFFGRTREIDAVLARTVGASKPQCVSVIGNRRMGKSSLFRQLVDVRGRELAKGPEPVLFAHGSLEGAGTLTIDRFFAGLLRAVEKQARRSGAQVPAPRAAATAEDTFAEWIEDLSDAGVRIVLFLDEFDAVTMNPSFDVGFFGRLRWLANAFSLGYVTSSIAELADLCHHEEIRQSPFFNIFSTLHLGLLQPAEARDLLVTESGRAGRPFDDEEMAFLDELAGRHPFHLQQAGNALWEAEEGSDGDAVRAAFLDDAAPHFRYAIAHLQPAQLQVLVDAAGGRVAGSGQAAELSFLLRRGLLVPADDRAVPFSPAFAEWLRGHVARAGSSSTAPRAATTPTEPDAARAPSALSDTADARSPVTEGRLVGGRYRIGREIGRGGFGVVFGATDEILGRAVAVKVLRPDRARGEAAARVRERFLQEARAASRINHPNVVTVHDLGVEGDDVHVVMELFHGHSLRSILDARGRLPIGEGAGLLAQAADGLAAAHALGIVHRDVKPDNLLVDDSGRLKIVDFGLAFLASQARITTDSRLAMTPRYSSPEQVLGEAVDARSDVFSLGCVIHEALSGTPAFDGDSVSAVFHRILYQTPPPTLGDVGLEPAAAELVRRCLARQPEHRPASCEDVARELRALA